ncbi:DUF3987 domain-containing protein [Antarctobacter jejuensis]|uniref:DUF3987 domain-containing protein n=1 Tax=Antarctobacter jejuensis TaxID=1439938 RepID=UPI003FD3DF26
MKMKAVNEIPFVPEWPMADTRLLRSDLPEPPELPLDDVFSPHWAVWIKGAAATKGAPPDYVMAALLGVCGSLIGNTRWPSPWSGWTEPPVIWPVIIGNPSASKSPAIDAVLVPLKRVERAMRESMQSEWDDWYERNEVAKVTDNQWKEAVKKAIKEGDEPPKRPASADPGPEPFVPRLAVCDATVEKLSMIVGNQPRGTLLVRDELAGWLVNMSRYSSGSDRPFWLEAYGGRAFSVERIGRDSVNIDFLTIGVLGGIQPDRLQSLLMKADDDGLLARFLPVWPNPAPVKRPETLHDEVFIESALRRLWSLRMPSDEDGHPRPSFVPFAENTRNLLDKFRIYVRDLEGNAEGLILSFLGKLPGMAVRLSLVLAIMDWASGETDEPQEISVAHFGKAAHLVAEYLLPMARRAYAERSVSQAELSARALGLLIREEGWKQFTAREVRRKQRAHLHDMEKINPALRILESADLVKLTTVPPGPKGGAPKRLYSVHPIVHEAVQ